MSFQLHGQEGCFICKEFPSQFIKTDEYIFISYFTETCKNEN